MYNHVLCLLNLTKRKNKKKYNRPFLRRKLGLNSLASPIFVESNDRVLQNLPYLVQKFLSSIRT